MEFKREYFFHYKLSLSELYDENEAISIIKVLFESIFHEDFYKSLIDLSPLSNDEKVCLDACFNRLMYYEPVQYITGMCYFYGRKFYVSKDVLIPRGETEEIIMHILSDKHDNNRYINVLDIGTGSGCIAVTLSLENRNMKVTGMDISFPALKIASINAKMNGADVFFIYDDILHPQAVMDRHYDLIVSNPPYITEKERKKLCKNVLDYEPDISLFVEDNRPLIFYEAIINVSKRILNKDGRIYFEINEAYGNEISALLNADGYSNIKIIKDLHDKDRIICASKLF